MILRSLALLTLGLAALPARSAAQNADFRWEGTIAAGQQVAVHEISGDIKVSPSTNGKVEVIGTKTGDRSDFAKVKGEVRQTARGIVICGLFEGMTCTDRGMAGDSRDHERRAQMDFTITVPPNVTISANSISGDVAIVGAPSAVTTNTVSGDVEISGARGTISTKTVSGDVRLDHLRAAAVSGTTVSGDISAQIDELTGTGNLEFKTVSGDVGLTLPRQLDVDLSMHTVSGEINSDFPLTIGTSSMRRNSIDAKIGNGGRRLSLMTISGDVKLHANK